MGTDTAAGSEHPGLSPEPMTHFLVATDAEVLVLEPGRGVVARGAAWSERRPTCLAAHPAARRRIWCGTPGDGVLVSEDGGASWRPGGLRGEHVTALTVSPVEPDLIWAGTEPSALWRSRDAGGAWERVPGLADLPSSSAWSFPPRPDTHHVRWIACHPREAGRLWLAIEAGALVTTPDAGATWRDRTPDGPRDTHELAIHPAHPEILRVSAGDGYFESEDGGATWARPREGLEVSYLRSVSIDPGDPGVVLVSAASRARSAYAAGRSDGRLYRRDGGGWERILEGWPDPPATIAPLLRPGVEPGELWAADERGIHRSADGGRRWELVAGYPSTPSHLRGFTRAAAPRSAPPARRESS